MYQNTIDRIARADARTHSLWLIIIIALGFFLRAYSLYAGEGYREFAVGDELHAFRVALNLLHGIGDAWYVGQRIYQEALQVIATSKMPPKIDMPLT